MSIEELIKTVEGTALNRTLNKNLKINKVAASDLMSDVLTLDGQIDVLITGLTNPQSIRTAEMADIPVVIIAKGKSVNDKIIKLAKEVDINLILTDLSVFNCCAKLYNKGLCDAK